MTQTQGSRQAVVNAIASYLGGAGITFLSSSNVFGYPPKVTSEGDFYLEGPGVQEGAMIFMRLATQRERRIELRGATGGGKMITYSLQMVIFFRSTKKKSQDAASDCDSFLDSLLIAIRASKTAGTNDGTVFQWGEGTEDGGEDVQLEVGFPVIVNGSVSQINARLDVLVLQQTTA